MNIDELRHNFTIDEIDLIVKALILLRSNVSQMAVLDSFKEEDTDRYIEYLVSINGLIDDMSYVLSEF